MPLGARRRLKLVLQAQFTEPRYSRSGIPRGHPGGGECVYALLIARLSERFRLMFFGNDRQSWTEFVTADLGIFRFEKVSDPCRVGHFNRGRILRCFSEYRSVASFSGGDAAG